MRISDWSSDVCSSDLYSVDTRSEAERNALRRAEADHDGIARLDGRCYVVSPALATGRRQPQFRMRKIIGGSLGAEHQSLFHVEVDSGSSPPFSAGLAPVILFVGRGAGTIEVSGRNFYVFQGGGLPWPPKRE